MKIRNLLFCLFILLFTSVFSQNNKREFRGAWIQTAFQERFIRMDALQAQKHLIEILDNLKTSGFNAVIFQVRPSADAFYQSDMEPWSRFLTGKRGLRPNQEWDPMAFMIVECHKRNMEFHACINPYRVTTAKKRNFTTGSALLH